VEKAPGFIKALSERKGLCSKPMQITPLSPGIRASSTFLQNLYQEKRWPKWRRP